MPHRRDVEAAADLDVLRDVAEVEGQQQDVRDALVPFALEVVLGQPEGVIAGPVHQLRDGLALRKHRRQMLVGKPALVRRRAVQPLVVQIDVAREQAAELCDHARTPSRGRGEASRCCRGRCRGSDNRRVPYRASADYLQKPGRHKGIFSGPVWSDGKGRRARALPDPPEYSFRHLTSPATRATLRITYRGLPEVPTPGTTW